MQGVEAPVVPACLNDARRLSNFRWCVRRADRSRARPRRPPCHILDQVWAKPPSLHACRLTNAIRLRTSHRGRNNRDPIYLVPKIQVFVHASALRSKSVASDIHTQCNICTILVSPDGIVCTTSLLPGPGRRGTRDSAGARYSREAVSRGGGTASRFGATEFAEVGPEAAGAAANAAENAPAAVGFSRGIRRGGCTALRPSAGIKKNGRLLSLRRARRRLRRGGRTRQLRVLNAEEGPVTTPQRFRQGVQINRTLAWRVARAGLVRGARRAGGGAIEPKLNVGEWEPPTLLL